MKTAAQTRNKHSRLLALLYQSPSVASVVALGVGLTASGVADAALIIQDINLTADNDFFDFDLDQDGNDDFRIKDKASAATIAKKDPIGAVLRKGNFAIKLAEGDAVSGGAGNFESAADLFNGSNGFWSESGDHGFAGLRLTFNDGDTHYGWIELTRGSIISGRAGFQNTPFAPAPIPAATAGAPEPGSLALLATGAAGLVSVRRRKRNAADKPIN